MLKLHSLLDDPGPRDHFVQLYTDDDALSRNVGRYLYQGLVNGEAAIAIATPEHRNAFTRELHSRGLQVAQLQQAGKLIFLDAQDTLTRFTVADRPVWDQFEATITPAFESLKHQGRGVRAYGEMVGLLWASGEYSAAIKLEEFWNRILGRLGATLYCSYPIDVFGPEFEAVSIHAILCDHTHLLPADEAEILQGALRLAINRVLGFDVAERHMEKTDLSSTWCAVPSAEQMILWVRQNFPNSAPEILRHARENYRSRSSALAC